MPNRGKMQHNERREYEQKFVYNTVKRVVSAEVNKSDKAKVERSLERVSTQVYHIMRRHEGVADLGNILESLAEIKLCIRDGMQAKLPPTLGRKMAREIYEGLVGIGVVLDPTNEYIEHDERPGRPAPINTWSGSPAASDDEEEDDDGLGQLSDGDEAGDIFEDDGLDVDEQIEAISAMADSGGFLPGALYLLEFARSPKEFWNALMTSEDLAACRDALARRDYSCSLRGGAKIFVRPEQYPMAVAAVKRLPLKPRHVVVAEEFEASVLAATEGIGKGVKPKGKSPVTGLLVQRTFITIPTTSSLRSEPNSDPATVSTSDANPRTVFHPRRV